MKKQNKTVLFLMRKDKISIRRYLMVAKKLDGSGIKAGFLNFTDQDGIIKETIGELGISDLPAYRIYHYKGFDLSDWVYLLTAKIKKHIFRRFKPGMHKNTDILCHPVDDGFETLLKRLNFDTGDIVRRYYESNIDWWEASVKLARNKIRKIKPDCIIYDLEMPHVTRTFLFAAKKEKVPIISMEHGEGFAEPYSNFPRLADHYIAYSPYNFEVIKNLQVPDENIHLTGMPDTDMIFECDMDSVKKEIRSRYDISFDRKIVTVSLKPANVDVFDKMNMSLIDAVTKVFGDAEGFYILIKPHNVDHVRGNPFKYQKPGCKNFRIIDSDYPFSRLLKISQYMITHMSSCIVEAAVMNVPTVVVGLYDNGIFSAWKAYEIFNTVMPDQLDKVLKEIKGGSYSFNCAKEAQERFIERFRFKYDNRSAERIANAIKRVIDVE